MILPDGYHDVPAGKLANVVTCLQMFQAPPARPDPPGASFELERVSDADPQWYRAFFRRIGGPYLWGSRLEMDDEELLRVLRDPSVEFYVLRDGGEDLGVLELDFRTGGEAELRFFGLDERLIGKGAGRWLMNRAIERAWSQPIKRFWVHTCTLDDPSAVAFYVRSGFVPYKRQVEVTDDPRIQGWLDRGVAPGVPIL